MSLRVECGLLEKEQTTYTSLAKQYVYIIRSRDPSIKTAPSQSASAPAASD